MDEIMLLFWKARPGTSLITSEFMLVFWSSCAPSGLWGSLSAVMNSCGRLARVFDRSSGLDVLFCLAKPRTTCRQCPQTTPPLARGQSTAANHTPGSDADDKPRVRAVDLARKIRGEKSKTRETAPPMSAQQRRVMELKRFSVQLQNVHPNVLAKHLHRSVLYQDKDVVIVNKPYGIPVAGKPTLGCLL